MLNLDVEIEDKLMSFLHIWKKVLCITVLFYSAGLDAKLLHLTFHAGCEKEITAIGKHFGIEIDTLNLMSVPIERYDGCTVGSLRYNITHKRAHEIWKRNRELWSEYDGFITSDTVPLSRIFLQNKVEKPLIIWACNRIDYKHEPEESDFRDEEYYQLLKKAKQLNNVYAIAYCPFEHYYAKKYHNIDTFQEVLRPIGAYDHTHDQFPSPLLNGKPKEELFFMPGYHNDQLLYPLIKNKLSPDYCVAHGRYKGVLDLKQYRGVIHIPYAWSNFALFEGLQHGVLYFIPSQKCYAVFNQFLPFFWSPPARLDLFNLAEWYHPDLKGAFIVFDSLLDLRCKIEQIDFEKQRQVVLQVAKRQKMRSLRQWEHIFKTLGIL